MQSQYDFKLSMKPDFTLLTVQLKAGQKIDAQPASMASMDSHIELKAGLKGGFFRSVGRVFAGERLVVNTYHAKNGEGEVVLAPGPMGDIEHYFLDGCGLILQRGAYVASGSDVKIGPKLDLKRGFFNGEGMVLLEAKGRGDLFFNTYGALIQIDVKDRYVVDTGYVVGFEDTLDYHVSVVKGLNMRSRFKSFLFGGEGLVCHFHGQGKLWIQTRMVPSFLRWAHPFRPVKKGSS